MNSDPLSQAETVVTAVNDDFVELQIVGSYETHRWPRAILNGNKFSVGEKIILELKNGNHSTPAQTTSAQNSHLHSIQKIVTTANAQPAKNDLQDPGEQRKLLESLIN